MAGSYERAAPPGAAPPDPGPDFRVSVAGSERPDRICSLLNRRASDGETRAGHGQRAAISGYYSRHLVPDIRSNGGDQG